MACTHSRTRVNAAICANLLGTTAVGRHAGTLVSPAVASSHVSGLGSCSLSFSRSISRSLSRGYSLPVVVGVACAHSRTRVRAAICANLHGTTAVGSH